MTYFDVTGLDIYHRRVEATHICNIEINVKWVGNVVVDGYWPIGPRRRHGVILFMQTVGY